MRRPFCRRRESRGKKKVEKIGIIDLGSNSARLVIVNLFTEGHFMVVDELKESVRLGQDMDRDGFLKPQRVAETIKTLKMFKRLCDASSVDRIIAVATAAVRRAKNQRSFLDEIQATCNIKIRVLSEEEEATLVYRGVINTMDIPKGLILEIGGGSTKIVYYNRRNMLNFATLPFGAVTLTDLFGGLHPRGSGGKNRGIFHRTAEETALAEGGRSRNADDRRGRLVQKPFQNQQARQEISPRHGA